MKPVLWLLIFSASVGAAEPVCEKSVVLTPTRRRILSYGLNVLLVGFTAHSDAEYKERVLGAFDSGLRADKLGAKDFQEAAQLGLLLPEDAARLFLDYQDELKERLVPLRMRIRDFVENDLWTTSAAATAEQILNDMLSEPVPETSEEFFRRLKSHPQYPKLVSQIDGRFDFTLRLWLTPNLRYKGKSDVEWLKLGAGRFDGEESPVRRMKRIGDAA
jgi:hypothetical protein